MELLGDHEMKTSELTGAALDWAVAQCEGLTCFGHQLTENKLTIVLSDGSYENFEPSCNWAQGGPIIDRNWISVGNLDEKWAAEIADDVPDGYVHVQGETALIAAMRCYVTCMMGDEVEVPDELISYA
jgi:hypothetical protein